MDACWAQGDIRNLRRYVLGYRGEADLFELMTQLFKFMKVYRKFWLAPIMLGLIALGVLLVAAQSSVFAPLIYAIF